MKRILVALTLFVAMNSASIAQTAPSTLTLGWINNDAAYGAGCPATAPKMCLGPITAEDITSLTPVIMSSSIAFNATSYTFTYPSAPSFGNHTYAVFATGFDANGNPVQSAAASVVVDVEPKLNAPVITSSSVK